MCVHQKKYQTVIRVDIIDNGPGIAKNILEKIFYPLVSGNQHGAGLGLSLAQDFVTLHKGMIEATSKKNKTCFSIILPIKNDLNDSEVKLNE
jgi:two-component system nitrogen regulation sensor histidine kinase GlnL